jgi:predicted nucleic acid-binding protein
MERVALDASHCTAKAAGLPILTRNVADFERIPGLAVVDYTSSRTRSS